MWRYCTTTFPGCMPIPHANAYVFASPAGTAMSTGVLSGSGLLTFSYLDALRWPEAPLGGAWLGRRRDYFRFSIPSLRRRAPSPSRIGMLARAFEQETHMTSRPAPAAHDLIAPLPARQ